MKFILLINVPYASGDYEHETAAWTPEAWTTHAAYLQKLNGDLAKSKELVQLRALTPPRNAKVVRHRPDGEPVISDGPFAEAKEFLAGFWIVEVADAERAYAIAARASSAPGPDGKPLGMPIEVREVLSAPPV